MTAAHDLAEIQACIGNRIDLDLAANRSLAGVIGDAPSRYSKSPALWNAAFRELGMDALYLPFDVEEPRLADLIHALRRGDRVLGANVTVPYKVRVIEHLDALDPPAERIRAVNTIDRTAAGKLTGSNTDGEGFLRSLLEPPPGRDTPFLPALANLDVLLLGAGGSARAVAFHMADSIGGGKLIICNRTGAPARALAEEIRQTGAETIAISENELPLWAPEVRLIINATVKGQGGLRKLPGGRFAHMEPYSALAPAYAAALPMGAHGEAEFRRTWLEASRSDIDANNRASRQLAAAIPADVGFCDLIYHPEETVFLRHGRETGHRTLNGRGMIVWQAAIAFCRRICRRELAERDPENFETVRRIAGIMDHAW